MNQNFSRVENIAKVAHSINKAYCEALGDHSLPTWSDAPLWQRDLVIDGVLFHLSKPEAGPQESHENWAGFKTKNGWIYGKEKDSIKKTHPCLVPFESLPPEQQAKDHIFKAVVNSLRGFKWV